MPREELYKVVQIDDTRNRAMPISEENTQKGVHPRSFAPRWDEFSINGEKFPVWTLPYYTAALMVKSFPNKYKLFQSYSFEVEKHEPSGAIRWFSIYPFIPKTREVPVLDDRGKPITSKDDDGEEYTEVKTEVYWMEDKDLKSAKRYFADDDNADESSKRIEEINQKVLDLQVIIDSSKQKIQDLEIENSALKKQLAAAMVDSKKGK